MNAAQAKPPTRTYQPLAPDYIRVLLLYPGLPGQQLKGSFELYDLRSSEPDTNCEAISYVCGLPIVAQQFYFSDSQLGIGRNLFAALERFRKPDRTRRIWCDGICINQDDSLERSRQVAMMGRIYRHTKRVLVCLGPASASDHLAFATITACKAVQAALRADRISQGFFPLIRKELLCKPYCDCCSERVALPANVAIEGSLAVMKLVRGPYFTPVWTIQEAAAGPHVELYCGMHHSSWQDFEWSVRVFYLFNNRPEHELGESFDDTSDLQALDADFYHVDQINKYREKGMQDKLTLEPQPHLDCWRYLCRTEDGQLGWVPPSARPGDYVAVFDGAPCPFIVRDAADGQYTLIGDAYIDGLSEEECFPAGDAEDHFLVLS